MSRLIAERCDLLVTEHDAEKTIDVEREQSSVELMSS